MDYIAHIREDGKEQTNREHVEERLTGQLSPPLPLGRKRRDGGSAWPMIWGNTAKPSTPHPGRGAAGGSCHSGG